MQDGGEYWGQCAAGTDHKPEGVDGDGHGVVLLDDLDGVIAEVADIEQPSQVVAGERDIGGFDGHIGSGESHRDPDVGDGESGCVVDSVAHHRHYVPGGVQGTYHVEFVLGQYFGAPFVDAQLSCHRV